MTRILITIILLTPLLLSCDRKEVSIPEATSEGGASVEVSQTYRIESPKPVSVSKPTANVVVKATPGFDVNPEFPWKFSFDGDGVEASTVKKTDIKFTEGAASVPFNVKGSPGSVSVDAKASFSMCKKGDLGACYFVRDEPIALKVVVNE